MATVSRSRSPALESEVLTSASTSRETVQPELGNYVPPHGTVA